MTLLAIVTGLSLIILGYSATIEGCRAFNSAVVRHKGFDCYVLVAVTLGIAGVGVFLVLVGAAFLITPFL